MLDLKPGQTWPLKADLRRLSRYANNRKLFKGEHATAFHYLGSRCERDPSLQRRIALILNYPGLIVKAAADILCGEPPKFVAIGEGADEAQMALNAIVHQSRWESGIYALATATAYRGDGVVRVRTTAKQVLIEQIPASSYFAGTNPDNDTELEWQAIAWVRDWVSSDGSTVPLLRLEYHYPGQIVNEAWLLEKNSNLEGSGFKVRQQLPLDAVYDGALPEVQNTGIDIPLVWHVANYPDGESFWSSSDYEGGLDTLFEACNNRISKIDSYLDKHQRPVLIGLPGMSDEDNKVDSRRDYIEPDNPDLAEKLPRYVTWDGQMEAAFKELDELKAQIRTQSETPRRLLGETIDSSIDSARAMLNDFIPIVKKVARKRTAMTPIVKEALWCALKLNELRFEGPAVDGVSIDIKWQDGVPQDYMESCQTEAIRVQNGLSSRQSAIERIDICTPEEAENEIERILAEQSQGIPGANPGLIAGDGATEDVRQTTVTGAAAAGAVGAREPESGPDSENE